MDISEIHDLVSDDLAKINDLINQSLASEVPLIGQLSSYIIRAGGKRIRPTLVALVSKAQNYQGDHHINVGTFIEFIHTATLLHDDVVDASNLRRGQDTANKVWGDEASVLVGDFLYSRAFEMMVELDDMRVMGIMANATNKIAEGEVMQLLNSHNIKVTEEQYLNVVQHKTAKLFAAAASSSALVCGADNNIELCFSNYGKNLGIAFQVADDVMDFMSESSDIGKNIGDDIAEGKPTLPLIHAIKNSSGRDRTLITEAIKNGSLDEVDEIISVLHRTGAIEYCFKVARKYSNLAQSSLSSLDSSIFKDALISLAEFSVERKF